MVNPQQQQQGQWEDIPLHAAASDGQWEDIPLESDVAANIRLQAQSQLEQTFPQKLEQGIKDVGGAAMQVIAPIGEAIDQYGGGAATRSAISALQRGESGVDAFKQQYGEDPSLAPTGKQIVEEAGVTQRPIKEFLPEGINQFVDKYSGGAVKSFTELPVSSVAGFGVDVLADPTNLIPGKAVAGASSKIAKTVAKSAPITKITSKLDEFAKLRAAKSFGIFEKEAKQIIGKAQGLQAKKRLADFGKTMMDHGITGPMPKSYEALAERAIKQSDDVGKRLGEVIDEISKAADELASGSKDLPAIPGQAPPRVGLNRAEIGKSLQEKLIDTSGLPGVDVDNEALSKLINEFVSGDGVVGIKDAQKLKEAAGKKINWKRDPRADIPTKELFYRELYSSLRQGIEDTAEALAERLGPDYKDKFIALKNDYKNLKLGAEIATKKAGKEFVNRYISLSDYQSGQFGGGAGLVLGLIAGADPGTTLLKGTIGAATGALANKGARRYLNQAASAAAGGASKAIKATEKAKIPAPAVTGAKAARAAALAKDRSEREKALKGDK